MAAPTQQEKRGGGVIEVDEEEHQEEGAIHVLEVARVVQEVGRNKDRDKEEVDVVDLSRQTEHHYQYRQHKTEEDQTIKSKKYRDLRSRLARKKIQMLSSALFAPHRLSTARCRLAITVPVTFVL